MIKKILDITNLAVFKNFEWDKSVLDVDGKPMQFEKVNIIYGRNYSGKTTLSRIMRAMETGKISDKYNSPKFTILFHDGTSIDQNQLSIRNRNVRVFNEDFVRDNLKFINNPDEAIMSFAILGDDNIALQEEISELISEIGSKDEGNETGLYAQLKTYERVQLELKNAYDQVAGGLEKQLAEKAIGRTNGIKYQLDRFGDPNYNRTKLGNDIQYVLSGKFKALGTDERSNYEQLLTERIKEDVGVLPSISLQWERFCCEAEGLLSKEIGESDKITELLRDISLNEWVKRGCELHRGVRTNCVFCGGIISDERWATLFKHFDDESRILENSIDNLLKQIENE